MYRLRKLRQKSVDFLCIAAFFPECGQKTKCETIFHNKTDFVIVSSFNIHAECADLSQVLFVMENNADINDL